MLTIPQTLTQFPTCVSQKVCENEGSMLWLNGWEPRCSLTLLASIRLMQRAFSSLGPRSGELRQFSVSRMHDISLGQP